MALEHRDLPAQLPMGGGGGGKSVMRRDGARADVANLIDVALAAGMHALADGTLASQFLDVSQETLDGLVLEGSRAG